MPRKRRTRVRRKKVRKKMTNRKKKGSARKLPLPSTALLALLPRWTTKRMSNVGDSRNEELRTRYDVASSIVNCERIMRIFLRR